MCNCFEVDIHLGEMCQTEDKEDKVEDRQEAVDRAPDPPETGWRLEEDGDQSEAVEEDKKQDQLEAEEHKQENEQSASAELRSWLASHSIILTDPWSDPTWAPGEDDQESVYHGLQMGWRHRRMIKIEEKAKVVAAVRGTELSQSNAALAILIQDDLKKGMNSSYASYGSRAIHPVLQISLAKIASATKN